MDQLRPDVLLDALPLKYYVIDLSSKRIVQSNDKSIKDKNGSCFKMIFDKDIPCEMSGSKCICQQMLEKTSKPDFVIESGSGLDRKYFKSNISVLSKDLILVNYIDITEQVNSGKELKINSKRLIRAQKLANFGYWEFNIDDRVVHASTGAVEIYGISGSPVSLEDVQKIPVQKYRKELDTKLNELIKHDKPYNVKFEIQRPLTGEIRYIHSIAEYRKDKRMVFGVLHDITDQEQSQKALVESLQNLKMAQRIAKIGNWFFDPGTNEIFWSEEVYKIFERNPGQGSFNQQEFRTTFGEQNYAQFYQSGKIAYEKGTPFQYQININLPDGNKKWIEIICQPEPEKGPGGYRLRGTIQDINESKLAEVELDNSNKLLRTVIENIPDAIYMKDKNFRKLVANKGDALHSGLENVSDIIGKSDYDLYPKEIAEMYIADDRIVMDTGKAVINREEILPFDDKFRWVLTSKIPLKAADNSVYGLVGIGRDITEIKEQQSKLKLLQQTIEQSPISVVITDITGKIEYVNPEFERTTGYTREEAIGKNPRILKSGEQTAEYYKDLWDTIRSGKNWHGEFHNRRKDGSMYWESAVIAPIYNERNELKQFVAIKEDVTQMKQIISELEIAKEKAEESDRLKTIFLANMSHEIRTPLNGILGFSNIICSGLTDRDKLQKYGKIIENSGKRLMTVIDDIIDISMIQSNQLKIENQKFNINELLEELYLVYKTQHSIKLQNTGFEVELCANREHGIIVSDKNRIFQIYKNLLDNAFKFTEKGMIKFGCCESDDAKLKLYVKDSGIGIAKEKTNVIFESFRQVEEGDSRKYDGSGLGLAIISGIIEKMGGEIEVQSEVNKGSVFYVTLPRNNSAKPADSKNGKNGAAWNINGKKVTKRIVSIEDDKTGSQYLKIIVDLMGFELINFDNAYQGIEYLKENRVDLVLIDVQLPEINGFEATRIIKSECPELPVIIQNVFAHHEEKDKAFQAGCDEYISKPVTVKVLKELIEKFTENRIEVTDDF